jgi:hypothetical protein
MTIMQFQVIFVTRFLKSISDSTSMRIIPAASDQTLFLNSLIIFLA